MSDARLPAQIIPSNRLLTAVEFHKLAEVPPEQRHELETELAAEHEKESGGLARALELGVVDEVIDPAHTRQAIATAIAEAFPARGTHGNIPL